VADAVMQDFLYVEGRIDNSAYLKGENKFVILLFSIYKEWNVNETGC
jgi:hypothetical protein